MYGIVNCAKKCHVIQAVCQSSKDHFADYELEDDVFEDDDRKLDLMRKNAAMLSL